jgi:hypothetical protein
MDNPDDVAIYPDIPADMPGVFLDLNHPKETTQTTDTLVDAD